MDTSARNASQIIQYIPDATVGQVVTVDGTEYKVTEINLARPDWPVLTRVS